MKTLFVTSFLTALMQLACSPKAHYETRRWAGLGAEPARPSGMDFETSALPVGSQEILFQTQKVEGVEVEGTYYKRISEQGQAEFVDYRWMSKIPWSVRRDLVLMRAQRPFALSYFLKTHEEYSRQNLVESPSLSLRMAEEPEVRWKFLFEREDGTLETVWTDRDFEVVEKRRAGSGLVEATAKIFPQGPLRSDLQVVLLRGLQNPLLLVSKNIRITTESDQTAQATEDLSFDYKVGDVRFSQVQVFFYLTQALEWFDKNLHFTLPFVLEAELQKGFPDKTNTAFYFRQKIRLGDGDGEVFDRIPMDPSIVTHESVHATIEAVAHLPYENEGGSLNEAFADFFTAVQLNNPKMGEAAYKKGPFKRQIESRMTLAEKNGGLYHDSEIVSGLLWELYRQLPQPVGLNLAWQSLLRLNPGSEFANFKQEILELLQNESVADQKKALAILKSRGWLE